MAIDDASRVGYVEIPADERAETAVGFLRRAVSWFSGHGVTIERVMTDNWVAYRSHAFADECRTLAIQAQTHQTLYAETNGKAERFIQPLLRECAYRFAYPDSQAQGELLPRYLHLQPPPRSFSARISAADLSPPQEQRSDTRQLGRSRA